MFIALSKVRTLGGKGLSGGGGGDFGIPNLIDERLILFDTASQKFINATPAIDEDAKVVDHRTFDLKTGTYIQLLEAHLITSAGERLGLLNIPTSRSYNFVQKENTELANDVPGVFYNGGTTPTFVEDTESSDKAIILQDPSFTINLDPLQRIFRVKFQVADNVVGGTIRIQQVGGNVSFLGPVNALMDDEVDLALLVPSDIVVSTDFDINLQADTGTFDVYGGVENGGFPFIEYYTAPIVSTSVGIFNPLVFSDGEILQYDASTGTLTPTNMIVTDDEFDIGNRTLVAGV